MTRTYRVASWIGVAGAATLGAGPALLRPPHTDEAGFLYLAGQVLEGVRHGADFYEINPPLAIWLSIPPVLMERGLGIPAWTGWIVLVLMLAVVCLLLCELLLDRLDVSPRVRAGFVVAVGFVILFLPLQEFSEREDLALMLVLPFALLAAIRVSGIEAPRGLAIFTGLLGGLGFSVKPHFLVAWLLLEVWLIARVRMQSLRRPELWSLVGVGVVYLLLVGLIAPDYIPMALRLAPVYHAYLYNSSATVLFMAGPVLLFLPGFALAIRAGGSQADPVRDALSLCLFGFLIAAVLQQKGLNYHFLAAEGAGFLLLVRAWQTRPPLLNWHASGIVLRLGFALILVIPLVKLSVLTRQATGPGGLRFGMDPDYPKVLSAVRQLSNGAPVLSLSSNMNDGWPLTLALGVRWASRYMHFWPMAAVYHDEILDRPLGVVRPRPYPERSGIERRFSDEVVEDLERYAPRVLVVVLPDSTEVLGGHARRFDYLGYFGSDPRFRDIIGEYREAGRAGIYRLLVRETASDSAGPVARVEP